MGAHGSSRGGRASCTRATSRYFRVAATVACDDTQVLYTRGAGAGCPERGLVALSVDLPGAGADLLPGFRPPDDCAALAGAGGGGRHVDSRVRIAPAGTARPWTHRRVVDAPHRDAGSRRQRRVP